MLFWLSVGLDLVDFNTATPVQSHKAPCSPLSEARMRKQASGKYALGFIGLLSQCESPELLPFGYSCVLYLSDGLVYCWCLVPPST